MDRNDKEIDIDLIDREDPVREDLLNQDEESDTIGGLENVESVETGGRRFGRMSLVLLIVIPVVAGLLLAGSIYYNARVGATFSDALSSLFAARSSTEIGRSLESEKREPYRQYHGDFVFHVAGNGRNDKILFCDIVLEFDVLADGERIPDDIGMRRIIYQAAKEVLSDRGVLDMPAGHLKQKLGKGIAGALKADAPKAVYITRFVVVKGKT